MSALEEKVRAVITAHEHVLQVERWLEVPGVYRGEADWLIAIRGANKELDQAIGEMKACLYGAPA